MAIVDLQDNTITETEQSFDDVVEKLSKQLCQILGVPQEWWKQYEPEVRGEMVTNSIRTLIMAEGQRLLKEHQNKQKMQDSLKRGASDGQQPNASAELLNEVN